MPEFPPGAAPRQQPGLVDAAALPRLVHPAPIPDPAAAPPPVAELTGWREALRWIADHAGPAPQRLVLDRSEDVDAALSMTFATLDDLKAWLLALEVPDREVDVMPQERADVPGTFALSRPVRFGLQLRLTAWQPTRPAARAEPDEPDEPDELAPAAPPLDELVDGDGVPPPGPDERAAAAARLGERWSAVTAGLAAGCPAPLAVNVSDDGWRVCIEVDTERAVMEWGRHLGILDTWSTRVHSPRRGSTVRTTTVGRTHPWAVEVSHTAPVTWPAAGMAEVLPWPAAASERLGAAA